MDSGLPRLLDNIAAEKRFDGPSLSALRRRILQNENLEEVGRLRPRIWEALLEASTEDSSRAYASLVERGPSRLHYKILLDLPRTLKNDPDVHRAGPARLRLLDAYVHWFDDQRRGVGPEKDGTAVPGSAAAGDGDATDAAAEKGTEEDDDEEEEEVDEEEDWDAPEPAPQPVTPSAVRAAQGNFAAVAAAAAHHLHSSQRATNAAQDLAAAAAEEGGYAQGMGSVAATLLYVLPPSAPPDTGAGGTSGIGAVSAEPPTPATPAADPTSSRSHGSAASTATDATAALTEWRAFASLRALVGPPPPHGARDTALYPLLRVRAFYEPGNSLVRRGCLLADDVLEAVDPALRAHFVGAF
jgi:hypothetical protein